MILAMGYGCFRNIWDMLASIQRRNIERLLVMNIANGMRAYGAGQPSKYATSPEK
jgi:hypothetical protein